MTESGPSSIPLAEPFEFAADDAETEEDRSPMPLAEAFREMERDQELGQEEEQQDSRPKSSMYDPFEKDDPWQQYDAAHRLADSLREQLHIQDLVRTRVIPGR